MNAVTTDVPALAHDAGVPPAPPEAHQTAGEFRLIPLKRLVDSPYNIRRTEPTGIEALATNIQHTGGLLQNLVVHAMKVGPKKAQTFGVAAGKRRRRALNLLVEQGHIAPDYEVQCRVVPVKDAVLMSVAENDMREPEHPADACDAYRVLIEDGRSIAEVADVYGVSEATVHRRLKLARVSPKLVDLFREGEIKLEQMQALALSDSHEEQEAAWFESEPHYRDPQSIRRRFIRDEQAFTSNRIARFVGVEAFEAAGGTVRRDLFSDTDAVWYRDHALMVRLATERLDAIAAQVQAEGWQWAKSQPDFDFFNRGQYQRVSPRPLEPTAEATQELAAIDKRVAEIAALQESDDTDDETWERLADEEQTLSARQAEIEDGLYAFDPSDMARAGVIVTLGHDGEPDVLRGFVIREPAAPEAATDGEPSADSGVAAPVIAPDVKPVKGPHSEKLTLRLNARRTAAVAAALANNPHVALAALIHSQMAGEYSHRGEVSAIDVSFHDQSHELTKHAPELNSDRAYAAFVTQREAWGAVIPGDSDALLSWLIEQTDEQLLQMLAQYVASTVDGVSADERPHAINALIPALGLNLADVWQPTKAEYFDHVSKQRIVDIVGSVVSPTEGMRLAKLKKADAATEAERLMAGRGWLPEHFAQAELVHAELWDRQHEADVDDAGDGDDGDSDPGAAIDRESTDDDDWPF
ncbi:ParB/RepB/Spo0J family partition protein [Burkholderia stagnalis]|uniref:ParB/RepB/Spo0J family partition protein n=1 Tax=Burkholderia stagnalis TaxID=1503054 RepID=UPI000F5BC13A|nr:ParB/RepB/Spo0J family partition protein [Burkholderia stagnalis]RQQ01030.1 nuclease [Burkholderia stagnalis]RQY68753.1 nuclease [Burkholderia stagnalis]